MIGKAEWFCARKFGWGLGVKRLEGGLYIAAAAFVIAFVFALPVAQEQKLVLGGIVFLVFMLDTLHIMLSVYSKLDEREQKHQAIAERNSSYVAIGCMLAYVFYVYVTAWGEQGRIFEMLAFPITVLVAMSLAKGLTLLHLERDG